MPPAIVDPDILHSIVLNLCHNSREHGARRVELDLAHDPATGRARLMISDDGPGIDPANAAKVFEPFFTTRRDQGGTGLGLALARSLLRAQRSTIELIPSASGARFEITFPVAAIT